MRRSPTKIVDFSEFASEGPIALRSKLLQAYLGACAQLQLSEAQVEVRASLLAFVLDLTVTSLSARDVTGIAVLAFARPTSTLH